MVPTRELDGVSFDQGLYPDGDGNATAVLAAPIQRSSEVTLMPWRYRGTEGWAELPSVPADRTSEYPPLMLGGAGGRAVHVKILKEERGAEPPIHRIVVSRYEPAAGWSSPEVLDETTYAYGITQPRAALGGDGSVLVVWNHHESSSDVGAIVFRHFDAAAGWTARAPMPMALPDRLLADGHGGMLALTYLHDRKTLLLQPFGANGWGEAKTIATEITSLSNGGADHHCNAAMSKGGAAMVTWSEWGRVRAAYFSQADGLKLLDVPAPEGQSSSGGYAPLVGLDAQGTATVVWNANPPDSRMPNWRDTVYARYNPAKGWTAVARIESQRNLDSAPLDLAVSDAGPGAVMWTEGAKDVPISYWVATLP
ncbi:hypothetical protein LZC95_33550 [Pendulispora brunnea]|uniref:Uncharacterized protein n=1 Tax=Pendulispora brunnea TaxID=2905690 RepID=A0ABZ2JZY2_9BACT